MPLNTLKLVRNNNKNGIMLPLVALGLIAVAGLVPFLIANTENNQKLSQSLDETNKQIWALEGAIELETRKASEKVLGLKAHTVNETEAAPISFKYGNTNASNSGFSSEAHVVAYNSHLNKNTVSIGHIHDKSGFNLSDLTASRVKPGTTVVNNTTYYWDKDGRLYQVFNNKLLPIPTEINGKNQVVWQVVSDGRNPIILTQDLKAYNLETGVVAGEGLYQLSAKSDTFIAGISDNKLYIRNNQGAADTFNKTQGLTGKIENVSVSGNHGLVLVDNAGNWEIWGWGNNDSDQLVCTEKDSEENEKKDNYYSLVKISDIFSKCKASGNPVDGAIIDISDFKRNSVVSAEEYFQKHYDYVKNPNGTYTITDPVTGETSVHHHNKKQEVCDCPVCKDILDPYVGIKNVRIPLAIPEDQTVEHLECYIDNSATGNLKTPLQFQILDSDGNRVIHTFTNSSISNEVVFEPYPQISKAVWNEKDIKAANLFLKQGIYQAKILDSKGKEVHADRLFFGWTDRPDDFKQNGAAAIKSEDQLYGGIVRVNHNLYNLRGGESNVKHGYDVNFYAVAAGQNFSLAVVSPKDWTAESDRPEYSIIGWGNNKYGQLGDSKPEDKNKEMLIIDKSIMPSSVVADYRDMQAGTNHALFLTKSGVVYSWGGSQGVADIYSVHQVKFLNDPKIVYISAGNDCSSALDDNGNLYTWSVNEGSRNNIISPIPN